VDQLPSYENDDWVEIIDSESNYPYYYSASRDQTQWALPAIHRGRSIHFILFISLFSFIILFYFIFLNVFFNFICIYIFFFNFVSLCVCVFFCLFV
jgi:hypothetical protein